MGWPVVQVHAEQPAATSAVTGAVATAALERLGASADIFLLGRLRQQHVEQLQDWVVSCVVRFCIVHCHAV
jgi:hypothetical protein